MLKGGRAIQETSIRYDDAALKASVARTHAPQGVCKRLYTATEAIQFFETGSADFLENSSSQRGRPFKGELFLKGSGRHGFQI